MFIIAQNTAKQFVIGRLSHRDKFTSCSAIITFTKNDKVLSIWHTDTSINFFRSFYKEFECHRSYLFSKLHNNNGPTAVSTTFSLVWPEITPS